MTGDAPSVTALRDAFDRLASGGAVAFEFVQGAKITFQSGSHGGMRRLSNGEFVFEGAKGQWESRARLLDPLTESREAFQYLDYDGAGDVGVVVSTRGDRGF